MLDENVCIKSTQSHTLLHILRHVHTQISHSTQTLWIKQWVSCAKDLRHEDMLDEFVVQTNTLSLPPSHAHICIRTSVTQHAGLVDQAVKAW